MSYDGRIMRQALVRFDEDKQRRAAEFARRRDRLYQAEPRLKEIEQQLRATMPKLISSALRRGTDPLPAVRVLRDENLALQRERAQLLTGMGYPADYLEEQPACPLCGDTGYHDGQVCRCLREYYKRAQLSELSQMLDLGSQSFETFSTGTATNGESGSGRPARIWSATSTSARTTPGTSPWRRTTCC